MPASLRRLVSLVQSTITELFPCKRSSPSVISDWELTAPWTGAQVKVPTKFITSEFDLVYHILGAKDYIHNGGFKKDVPLLEEVVVIEGAAHFVNQERPDEISKHIYDFIQKF
ncbi:hypothetical protein FXO37_33339 [Capsicum annuum]|nr:hypothetical protein FXO37_33339 [Capsicum annuum]